MSDRGPACISRGGDAQQPQQITSRIEWSVWRQLGWVRWQGSGGAVHLCSEQQAGEVEWWEAAHLTGSHGNGGADAGAAHHRLRKGASTVGELLRGLQ